MFKAGDKVRCIRNDGQVVALTVGKIYELHPHQNRGDEYVVLLKDDRNRARGGGEPWFANRFELVKEVAPEPQANGAITPAPERVQLTAENAKVGATIYIDDKNYKIESFNKDNGVKLAGNRGGPYPFNYFHIEVPVEPVAAPGPKMVMCVEGYRPAHLVAGRLYTVNKETDKLVSVVEIPGKLFARRRFAMEAAPAVAPKPIEVGDMVYVVAKAEGADRNNCAWPGAMDEYLNNGIAYKVESVTKYIRLSNRYSYLPECLSHTPKGVVASAPNKPAVAPPKPLAEDVAATLRAKKAKAGRLDHHITSFAYKVVGKKEANYCINPACYAELGYKDDPIEQFIVDTQCHVHLLGGDPQKYPANILYFNYLFNDSPWAPCFITKDAKEALEKGVVMDCNRPISELVGAATAVRESIEQKLRYKLFKEMMDAGYHGNTAYLMSVSFSGKDGNYTLLNSNDGHTAISTSLGAEALISFFKSGYAPGGKAANVEMSHYQVYKTIDKNYGKYHNVPESFFTWTGKNAKVTQKGTGWQAVSVVTKKSLYEFASMLETLVTNQEKK